MVSLTVKSAPELLVMEPTMHKDTTYDMDENAPIRPVLL